MLNILLDQSDVARALVTTKEDDILEGYVAEMLRVDPPIQGIYRVAKATETIGSTTVNADDLVYLDVSSANLNVGSDYPRSDDVSHKRLGARVCGTHEDQSLSAQGSLHPRGRFD